LFGLSMMFIYYTILISNIQFRLYSIIC